MERKLFRKTDVIIIVLMLLTAALFQLFMRQSGTGEACRVLYNGAVVKTVSLGVDGDFTVHEAPDMVFEIKGGRVAAARSGCPDKTCVNTGFIGSHAQKIVCLPNKIVVEVTTGGTGPDAPDMVTW